MALSACTGGPPGGAPGSALRDNLPPVGGNAKIEHVVLIIQENRSFDDFFADFPGVDGATTGKTSDGKTVRLHEAPLAELCDFGHSRQGFLRDYAGGKMDGFNLEGAGTGCGKAGLRPYQYVNPAQIAPYWQIAAQYAVADRMFQTQGSGSFTGHQDLIAGGTAINPLESLVDFPSHQPWGCDARANTVTSLLRGSGIIVRSPQQLKYLYNGGPFPCLKYKTLRDLLDAQSVQWKYYSPKVIGSTGAIWSAFDAIKAVRVRQRVADQRRHAALEVLRGYRSRYVRIVYVDRARQCKLRPPRESRRHRSVVGCVARECHRRKQVLAHDGDRHGVGRLGRLLRPRTAAVF